MQGWSALKVHGGAPRGFLDFSAPSNPLGPPPIARALLSEATHLAIGRYPDPSYRELARAIAQFYGFDEKSIIPLNGAAEAYSIVPLALRPRTVISVDPTFGDIDDICRASGARRICLCMYRSGRKWLVDRDTLREVLRRVEDPCLVILSIPNNPTGSADLYVAIEEALSRGCFVLADYAFADLSTETIEPVIEDRVLAVFSLTKLLALPGLRIGFLVTIDREIYELLDSARQPWNVNALAADSIRKLLLDYGPYLREFVELSKNAVSRLRSYLVSKLEMLGLEVFESVAPYVLVRHESMDRLARCLERRRIAIRLCSSFTCLDKSFARVSVRPLSDIDKLVEAMRSCLETYGED